MTRRFILLLIAFIISVSAFASDNTQICFSREENGGVLNIRGAEITANGKHLLWIYGGESKCVEVAPGQYSIIAQSPDPYNPNDKNPATWKSQPLMLSVQGGSKLEITVLAVSQGATYVGPWQLKQ